MKVYVTGYGVISSIGVGEKESLRALKDGVSGIKRGSNNTTKDYNVGAIELTDNELIEKGLKTINNKIT